MLEISKIACVKAMESCVKSSGIFKRRFTRDPGNLIATRDSARTIMMMAEYAREFLFQTECRARERLHIPMEDFKWECLLMTNMMEKLF